MIQGDSDYAAHERTFLAWLRTGIAVVVRSLGNLNDLETIAVPGPRPAACSSRQPAGFRCSTTLLPRLVRGNCRNAKAKCGKCDEAL